MAVGSDDQGTSSTAAKANCLLRPGPRRPRAPRKQRHTAASISRRRASHGLRLWVILAQWTPGTAMRHDQVSNERRNAGDLAALNAVAEAIAGSLSLTAVLDALGRVLADRLGIVGGVAFLRSRPNGRRPRGPTGACPPGYSPRSMHVYELVGTIQRRPTSRGQRTSSRTASGRS